MVQKAEVQNWMVEAVLDGRSSEVPAHLLDAAKNIAARRNKPDAPKKARVSEPFDLPADASKDAVK